MRKKELQPARLDPLDPLGLPHFVPPREEG